MPDLVGVWCVDCELVTANADIVLSDGWRECPHCGAGEFDLWRIQGSFTTGDYVETASNRLADLCEAFESANPDFQEDW